MELIDDPLFKRLLALEFTEEDLFLALGRSITYSGPLTTSDTQLLTEVLEIAQRLRALVINDKVVARWFNDHIPAFSDQVPLVMISQGKIEDVARGVAGMEGMIAS